MIRQLLLILARAQSSVKRKNIAGRLFLTKTKGFGILMSENNIIHRERYDNLDGLRVISCLSIIAMHIKANSSFEVSGWVSYTFIPSLTQLVTLFLIISGFGMFCGYYDKFKNKTIDLNTFYSKRYWKILPFFAALVTIDLLLDRSIDHLIEGVTEVTLVFGLLPSNNLSVIGVGWTLGIIFLFYLLFPYVVFLCWTKRRAVFALCCAIGISLLCTGYFFTDKFVNENFAVSHDFLYNSPYFLMGGVIYLFRKQITALTGKIKWLWLLVCIGVTVGYYFIPDVIGIVDILVLKNLLVLTCWLIYAISVKSLVLSNRVMKFLSGISLEMYLAHMIIFRFAEKLHLLYLFGKGWISYIFAFVFVTCVLILLIFCYKKAVKLADNMYRYFCGKNKGKYGR